MQKDKEVLGNAAESNKDNHRGFGTLTYEDRLENLGLTKLNKKRCKGESN